MLGSRFLWQVWGVLGITLIISTFVFGFFVIDEVERDAFDRIENSLHEQALALSPMMTTLLEENRLLTQEENKPSCTGNHRQSNSRGFKWSGDDRQPACPNEYG